MQERIESLERRVRVLERIVGARVAAPPAPQPTAAPPPPPEPAAAPVVERGRTAPMDTFTEARVVGTWFARLGALAILLGAAFGYAYAVDRGLITPAWRVITGMAAAAGLIGVGAWARRKEWDLFSMSMMGGGLGLLHLSLWAAHARYGLVSAEVGFALLVAATAFGVLLALRLDSPVLAGLAAFGAYLNPFLVAGPVLRFTYLYLVLLALGALGLAGARRWAVVDRIALAGTWVSAFLLATEADLRLALPFGIVIAAIFAVRPLVRRRSSEEDLLTAVGNAAAFTLYGLWTVPPERAGLLVLCTAGAYAVLWLAGRRVVDRPTALTHLALAAGLATLAVPLQFRGPVVAAMWAVEGVVIAAAGLAASSPRLRAIGAGVVTLSLGASLIVDFELGMSYLPERLLLSPESALLALQVVAVSVLGVILSRSHDPNERRAAGMAALVANLVALAWLTFEGWAWFERHDGPRVLGTAEGSVFITSAVWALYGAAALAFGVLRDVRLARMLGAGLLAVTVLKVALADAWVLGPGFRVVVFTGLGLLLLISSVMYQRLRALVVGESP